MSTGSGSEPVPANATATPASTWMAEAGLVIAAVGALFGTSVQLPGTRTFVTEMASR